MSNDNQELLDIHNKFHTMIDECDVKLDSLQDPETAGKTKIINERVASQQERADKVVNNLVQQLESSTVDEKIGIFYALVRGLNNAYKVPVEAAITELLKEQPKIEPLISEEEAEKLQKVRSDLAQKVKQIIGMATVFSNTPVGEMPEGFREAKKRTGKQGKRGPRALSFYTFSIGDTEYADLSAVQEVYSQYYNKTADITAAMRGDTVKMKDGIVVLDEKGKPVKVRGVKGENNPNFIDTSDPADTFSFTLPDGNLLVGTKQIPVATDTDDEDDDTTFETEEVEEVA